MASIVGQFSAESLAGTYGSTGVNAVFSSTLLRQDVETTDEIARIYGDTSNFGSHIVPAWAEGLSEGGGGAVPPTTGWIFPRGKA